MFLSPSLALVAAVLVRCVAAQQIINGQIFTPGLAIVNSPQPNTPMGGDTLHISLDVSANGKLQLPPYPANPVSAIFNISIFLSSYTTGRNFTIANGTAPPWDTQLGNIMLNQAGSTVKHVNWVFPDCLVGNGPPTTQDSARGLYNISIHQNFRLNNVNRYTIFDLPIRVTNQIPFGSEKYGFRPACDSLNNPLLSFDARRASADDFTLIPGTAIDQGGRGGNNNGGNNGGTSVGSGSGSNADGGEESEFDSGLFGEQPDALPEDGLGNSAGSISWRNGAFWVWIPTIMAVLLY